MQIAPTGVAPALTACIPGCFDQRGLPTGYEAILLGSVNHAEANPAIADARLDHYPKEGALLMNGLKRSDTREKALLKHRVFPTLSH